MNDGDKDRERKRRKSEKGIRTLGVSASPPYRDSCASQLPTGSAKSRWHVIITHACFPTWHCSSVLSRLSRLGGGRNFPFKGNVGTLESRNAGKSESQNIEKSACRKIGKLEYRKVGMLECRKGGMWECRKGGMWESRKVGGNLAFHPGISVATYQSFKGICLYDYISRVLNKRG